MADVASPTHNFDLVLLGGGTGGYVAAIRAKQLGLTVAVVEEWILGGCCLHRGCIPTKAYLKSADMFDDVKRAGEFGVDIAGDITFNYPTALGRSKGIVDGQYKGLRYLFDKKHQIPVFMGRGKLLNKTTVGVTPNDGSAPFSIAAKNIIINTGSRPRAIKGIPFDGKMIISSDHTVTLAEMPKCIVVRGGGATGLEWATVYHRYGVPTTLVGNVVPQEDEEIQQALLRALQRQKMDIIPGARPAPEDYDVSNSGVTVRTTDAKGKERVLQAESLMVAIGREACVEDIGLEEVGIALEGGFIKADSMLRTNVDGIYAIGDVNGQQMLAHTAMHHGIIAVEHMTGHNPFPLDVLNSPSCTYCQPEIGSVGYYGEGSARGRVRCEGRQIPDETECQGEYRGPHRRLREDRRRCADQRFAGCAHHRTACDRDDRRGRSGALAGEHAIRIGYLGASASDCFGSNWRGGARLARTRNTYLADEVIPMASMIDQFAITSVAELREIYREPKVAAAHKVIDHVDVNAAAFIARSPFLLLATVSADGRLDVSPKGEGAGFIHVRDEKTLLFPDRPGNNRIDGMQNIVATGRIGLIFLVPGIRETLSAAGP